MTDTETNYLLDALDALTKPIRTKVVQDGPIGSGLAGSQVAKVELPPLLTQLEEAIRGTIGIGGSGSLPNQRNVLDADALYRFSLISSTIRDWARMAGAVVTPDDAVVTLRDWYVAYSAKSLTLDAEKFYTRQMTGWAKQITDKLNPPRVWDLPDACPVCGSTTYWSKATAEEYPRPLVVEYHETGADLIQQARALCRACEQVWSVRELAYALEQDESAKLKLNGSEPA